MSSNTAFIITSFMRFILTEKKNEVMTIHHCKLLWFGRARFYKYHEVHVETEDSGRIWQYFKCIKDD